MDMDPCDMVKFSLAIEKDAVLSLHWAMKDISRMADSMA